jgi:hypothetical protein
MKILKPRLSLILMIVAAFPWLLSCTSGKRQHEPLARVNNNYLYRDDLSAIFPGNISSEDSAKLARNYIDKWVRNQLFLRLAEINLPDEEKNVEKQIADFRATLLIHKYQQYLLGQKLDTIITIQEIDEYYENHSNNFILDQPAIRGVFLKVRLSSPNRDRILTWFRNENDYIRLENYSEQYAETRLWFNDDWVYLNSILGMLPPGSFSPADNLSGRDHLIITDSEFQYFLGISEFLDARSRMPATIAAQKIKSIILNKRKIKFLNELEKSVLSEGFNKNAYQYF